MVIRVELVTSPGTPSPVEAVVAAELGELVDASVTVAQVPSGPLLLRADLRVADLEGRAAFRGIADAAVAGGLAVRAAPSPPNLYLTPPVALLVRAVLPAVLGDPRYGDVSRDDRPRAYVSFSNPNLNKPLHVGHLRNNTVGVALGNLLDAAGFTVTRGETISDWGRHICQAVVGYRRWGAGVPEGKPDHAVGGWYARFVAEAAADPAFEEEATTLLAAARAGDAAALADVRLVTGWVMEGIRETYARIGTSFDRVFLESDSLPTGDALIHAGIDEGMLARRSDGSVFVDLTSAGLGEVTLVRRDGSPVAYTQLVAVNVDRWLSCPFDVAVIVSGHQWSSGHAVIDAVLRRLGHDLPDRYHRVHYGMVRLPEGAMRSRLGSAVLVDDLLDELTGRLAAHGGATAADRAAMLAKYHLLRVRIEHDVVFDFERIWRDAYPELERLEAARALATSRSATHGEEPPESDAVRTLLLAIDAFPRVVARAVAGLDPSGLVRHARDLATATLAAASALPAAGPVWAATAQVLDRAVGLLGLTAGESRRVAS